MKSKALLIALIAALLLSSCRVEGVHTMGTIDFSATSGDIEDDVGAGLAPPVTEITTTESTLPTSEVAATEDNASSTVTSDTTTEATTTADEVSSAPTSEVQTPTLPPATEAEEEEIVEDEEASDIGYTSDGDPFDIDPDYAYFIVNKELRLPEDYSIELDTVQGKYEMEKTAAYFCRQMIAAAKEDGISLKILSAYRTVKYQERLFERNLESRMDSGMTYEEAYADVSVNIAPPGGSEHNAGLAVDIITEDDWDTYEGFEDTEEFAWLRENAADFGFIMRYHKGKEHITGYIYEPWHYRYVGVKYARTLQDSGLCMEEYFELYE